MSMSLWRTSLLRRAWNFWSALARCSICAHEALERIRAICKRNRVRTPNKKTFWMDLVWLWGRRHGKGIPGVLDRSCMYLTWSFDQGGAYCNLRWKLLVSLNWASEIISGCAHANSSLSQNDLCAFPYVLESGFELPVVRHGRLKKSESKNAFWT